MQQTKMVRVTNPSNEPFSYRFGGEEYTVPAGEVVKGGKLEPGSVVLPEPVAKHLAVHAKMCDRKLVLGLEPVQATYAPAKEQAQTYRDPDTGQEYATLEELTAAIKARTAAQFQQKDAK